MPYGSKEEGNEDHLTRAFLVLLRFVPLAHVTFLDIIREFQDRSEADKIIPPLSGLITEDADFATQVQTQIDGTGRLISVIISDEHMDRKVEVKRSERKARYDGVITYRPNWIIVIENKLSSGNIWDEQLNPSIKPGAEAEIVIDSKAISIKWRDIIEKMSSLLECELITGAEAKLMDDFFQHVDSKYPFLNPFTSFGICKDNEYLLKRRCHAIMEVIKLGRVEYHRGWKSAIRLDSGSAREIALSPKMISNGEWEVILEMYPGDTISQARELFDKISKEDFLNLQHVGWNLQPCLHFSYIGTGLHGASTCLSIKDYIEYWITHKEEIKQYQLDDCGFMRIFNKLLSDNMISKDDAAPLEKHFVQSKREFLNLCPGISVNFKWSMNDAIRLDKDGNFEKEVANRIKQACTTWQQRFF
jgi:hypothetical protein